MRETDRQIRKRNGGREKGVRRYQDIYVGDDKGERLWSVRGKKYDVESVVATCQQGESNLGLSC